MLYNNNFFGTAFICFILLLLVQQSIAAQTKYEKETRISIEKIPELARANIALFPFRQKKIKWYKEISNDGITYEAKVKYKKRRYSVEYDEKGHLLDVEKSLHKKDISQDKKDAFKKILCKEFSSFIVVKIQEQYTGAPSSLIYFIENGDGSADKITKNYEVVVEGRLNDEITYYEYLIDQKMTTISKTKISIQNTDVLEF